MKIRVKKIDFSELENIKEPKRRKPLKPNILLKVLIKVLSFILLKGVNFKYEKINMEKTNGESALVLMNHSSFVDLQIASQILWPKSFNIVCTTDGFVGMSLLMRLIGCIPTKKFISDISLISDIKYALKKNNCSVLMYPEAGYSLDGRATVLPRRLGVLLKRLDVPVIMISTYGAYARQPLYNLLKLRKVNVSAKAECILSREEIKQKSVDELDDILQKAFTFDYFLWQQQNNVKITEKDRAEGLERILYKCDFCGKEGKMKGEGTKIKCNSCGRIHTLNEIGFLEAKNGKTKFSHIPDWIDWQRQEVQKEILSNEYRLESKVKIFALKGYKALYEIGSGELLHTVNGFLLKGCSGKLEFTIPPTAYYTLNADFYWYQIGDIICLENEGVLYYCVIEDNVSVTKARIATEEIYKLNKKEKTS